MARALANEPRFSSVHADFVGSDSVVHEASSSRLEHSRANFGARLEVARGFYKYISLLYYTVVYPLWFLISGILKSTIILQQLTVNIPLSYNAP